MQLVWACLLVVVSHVSALSGNSLSGGGARGDCFAPQDVGICTGQEEAWYYSETEGRCIFFVYSGCGGNANRFASRQECEEACEEHYCPDLDCPASCRIGTGPDGCEVCACTREEAAAVCRQPMKRGYCRALHHKWAWSQAVGACVSFVYGGCGGTKTVLTLRRRVCKCAAGRRHSCRRPPFADHNAGQDPSLLLEPKAF